MDKRDPPKTRAAEPAPKRGPKDDDREARLAAALRANLRRRKAVGRGDQS
jgi:hypothetical protein